MTSAVVDLTTDPLSQVYTALANALESFEPLRELVKIGNIIRHDDENRDRREDFPALDADRPEITLTAAGGVFQPWFTNTSIDHVERFRIGINSGDRAPTEGLYPVRWALYRAIAHSGDLGLNFVSTVMASPVETDVLPPGSDGGGLEGWIGLMNIDVRITINRSILIEES